MADADLRAKLFGNTDLLAQQVQSHPEYRRAQAMKQPVKFRVGEWDISVQPDGSVSASRGGVVKPLLAAGAVFAGGLALGALGPAAASGSGGAAQGAATSGASGAAGIPTIPSTTYGSLAPGVGTGAATGGAGLLGTSLGWGDLAKLGMQGLASWQGSRAANNAAQQQVDAANKALAFAKSIYDEQRANQAPFIGIGHGSANTLAHLMGLSQPQPMQGGPLSSLGGQR